MSFYDIKITGKDVKRFIHNLYKMHIELLNIVFDKNSVIVRVSDHDYKKILDIKTIYEIEIVKIYGVAHIKSIIKNYWLFFIIMCLGFIMFLSLTNVIFEVEVIHNDKDMRNLIIEELKNQGVAKYNFVVSYNKKEEIKKDILKKYKDKIEWLEIERQGTKYTIKVEERKKKEEKANNIPQNIIAKKDGLIKKITSSSGEIVAKKDQYVKKGDVLISGTIHNKEEIVAKVPANGEVYAETWYTVTIELPYHYHEEKKTDNNQTIIDLKWFDNSYHFFDFKKYKNNKEEILFQIKSPLLPISVSLVNEHEIEVIDKIYTKNNVINDATDIAKKHLKQNLGENITILFEKNLKITEENSKIIIVMFYKIYENITDYQKIPEITEEIKKEE